MILVLRGHNRPGLAAGQLEVLRCFGQQSDFILHPENNLFLTYQILYGFPPIVSKPPRR